MLTLVSRAAPNLPADAQVAIAGEGQSGADTLDTAQSIAGYGDAVAQVNALAQHSQDQQSLLWKTATADQQALWSGVGYKPPSGGGSGFLGMVGAAAIATVAPVYGLLGIQSVRDALGNVGDAVGSAAADAFGAVESIPGVRSVAHTINNDVVAPVQRDVINPVVTDVVGGAGVELNALGSGARTVQHLYRAGELTNQTDNPNNVAMDNPIANAAQGLFQGARAGAQFLGLASSSDWADTWHKTTNGDQTFDPNQDREIQAQSGLDDASIGMAKAAAGTPADIEAYLQTQLASGMSSTNVAALRDKMNDPGFQAVVQQYKDAKLSFGRSLIPSWMWQNAHPLAETLSGAGDLAFNFLDPFLELGKVAKVARIAPYVFKAPEEIDAIAAKPAVQRLISDVVSYLAQGKYGELLDRYPDFAPIISGIAKKVDAEGNVVDQGITDAAGLRSALTPTQPTPEQLDAMNQSAGALSDAKAKLADLKTQTPLLDPSTAQQRALLNAFDKVGLAQIDTNAKMVDWMKGNVLALHILSGGGASVGHGNMVVPSLTAAGKVFLDAKGALRNGIDWAADKTSVDVGPGGAKDLAGNLLNGAIGLVGTTAKRMTTLVNVGGSFNPSDADSVLKIQRFANTFLPRQAVNALVDAWVQAPDNGARRNIYLEMLRQTFNAAGVNLSDDSALASHFTSDAERAVVRQQYSFGENGFVRNADGTTESHGLLAKHLTDEWSLPSFKELSDNAARGSFNKMVYGIANNPMANAFSAIWKPLQLLRVGFPVRVSLEELAGGIAREGGLPVIQAALAGKVVEGAGSAVKGPLSDLNPLQAGVSRLLRELPESRRQKISSLDDLNAEALAGRTQRFLKYAAEKVPGVTSLANTVRKYPAMFDHGLPSEISSAHTGSNMVTSPDDVIEGIKTGMKKDRLALTPRMAVQPSGDWQQYPGGAPGYMSSWMRNLDDIAGDPLARPVLANLALGDLTPEQLVSRIADKLQSPEMKQYWDQAARANRLSDPRVVGVDATARQAAEDWASHLITHVKGYTHEWSPGGDGITNTPHAGLMDYLLDNHKSPDLKALTAIPSDVRPPMVHGPEFVSLPTGNVGGLLKEFVDSGFMRIGHAVDFMSRQPLFILAVHKADKQISPVIDKLFEPGTAMHDEVMQTLVRQSALRQVMPYIHNPAIRSQMNVLTQNLAPFQFAQDQFWKRWARTFYHSPEAIREAQLAHHSLGASGFTHQDDQGNEIFTYPASGFVQKALTDGFGLMGIPATLPVKQAFTGQLKMVAPGLDRTFAPSFGPLVSIPLNAIARQFHEFQPVTQSVLGNLGAGRPMWEEIVPASISRVVNATIASDSISPSYANAEMRVIQDMYANKLVPTNGVDSAGNPLPMTAQQRQDFMRRVADWTRINMFARALIGFDAPAAPASAIGDTKIGIELRQLSAAGVNFSDAMAQLMKANPDAFPYEVFMSQGAGKEPLPATTEAAAMLQQHSGFFAANPGAGGFFLPQKSSSDKFSNEAYKEQLLYQLRTRRSPQEFLDQMQYTQAATDYYDTRDAYNAQAKDLTGDAKQQLANAYGQWKAQYLHDHPVFADKLQAATAVIDRGRTMQNLQVALKDPNAPKTPQVSKIQDLVDTYQAYQAQLLQWKGMTSSIASNTRKQITANFDTWGRRYVNDNPETTDVWNSLIRPEVEVSA